MDNSIISIIDTVGDSICIEAEDGQKIFELMKPVISENRKVNLSFLNIETLSTAFLDTAIGQLYRELPKELVKANLEIEFLSLSGQVTLKRVVDAAKLFYEHSNAI